MASSCECDDQNQRLYRDTLDGLTDVDAGRVIEGDWVLAWIEFWGSESDVPRPRVCRGRPD